LSGLVSTAARTTILADASCHWIESTWKKPIAGWRLDRRQSSAT